MLELRQLPQLQEAGTLVRRNRHPDVLVPRLHLRDPGPLQGLSLQGSRLVLVLLRLWPPPPVSSQDGATCNQECNGTGHSQVFPDTAWGLYSAGCPYSVSEGVTLAQLVKASVGQTDVPRFEPHLGHK